MRTYMLGHSLVVGLLTMALTACAGEMEQVQRQMEEMAGRATKDQILAKWGPPRWRGMGDQGEVWLYHTIALEFDREGILRGWFYHPH